MGRRARYIPVRLPEKLTQIRKALGLTQQEMLERLDLPEEILQTSISQYERGKIEPPIFVLLRYADVANIWLEVLLRDQLDLPNKLPSTVKHEGVRITAASKSGSQRKKPT
jgi:transcriptional regulator with XRE-family HTH domain